MINFERHQQPTQQNNNPVSMNNINTDTNKYDRYVGYSDENSFRNLITKLYINTKKDGLLITKPIANPSKPEIDKFQEIVGAIQNVDDRNTIYNIITKLISTNTVNFLNYGSNNPNTIADIIYSVLQDAKQKGSLANMLKNSVITFVCWFIRFNAFNSIKNILYVGTPSKNEIYWLYIMHRIGCKVTTISYIDDTSEYLKVDTQSKYSNLIKGNIFNPLNIDFKNINVDDYLFDDKIQDILSQNSKLEVTHLDIVSPNNVLQEISTLKNLRLGAKDNIEPTYFILLSGFDDEDSYRNMLFNIWKDITNSPKPIIKIDDGLEKPTYEEGTQFYSINRNNAHSMILSFLEKFDIPTSKDRTILAKKKFTQIMTVQKEKLSNNALFSMCVNVCVWFKQCTDLIDFQSCDIPVFFFYGNPNSQEYILMELLSSVGFDIVIACPDKSYTENIKNLDTQNTMQTLEYSQSGLIKPFPDKLVRAKVTTTAYNASRDLDNILYNDGNMFRDRHYNFCQTVTLKSTFEEISILWNVEAKYRQGFSSDENSVTVPNIFAKLDGVPYGDIGKYWKDAQSKLTPNSIYFRYTPIFKPFGQSDFNGYFNGNRLNLAKIKSNYNINKYGHLPNHIQDFIFQKMQEIVDSGYLKIKYPDIMHLVIKVGTSLPTNILQLIQNFDFTKEIPKIVIAHVTKNPFSVYECILLLLLNFMGFDIIIYTPTGYQNIEKFIDIKAFEQYNIGEYKYDVSPPNLKIPKAKNSKIFGFFRKK